MSAKTKKIDVRPQASLSLQKSFRFCRKGISYRLFRSSLTLAVVVVAVAFFMVLLSESVIVRSVSHGVRGQMERIREADVLIAHLFQPKSSRDVSVMLSAISELPAKTAEFSRVAGITVEQAETLAGQCRLEQIYTAFFQNLAVGKRVILVKKNEGRDVFVYLSDAENWSAFEVNLSHMRSVRLPTERETLHAFLTDYPAFIQNIEAARGGFSRTMDAMQLELKALTGGQDQAVWLAEAGDAAVEQWRQVVTGHGVELDADTMARVRAHLTVSHWESAIIRTLQSQEKRGAWKKIFITTPGIETKMLALADPRVGEILDGTFTSEQLTAVAGRYASARHLRELVSKLPVSRPGVAEPRFLGGQQMFLVVISFLVCMVGIANAMLMAITERFREIATMKCLGATDGFILKQFLIEAAIQGFAGGFMGTLIGLIIAVGKSCSILGGSVFAFFPVLPILLCALFTLTIGVLLAMLASVYPSHAAASMAPMDAMRVE